MITMLVIISFAIVQSLFGIGLLVFGTPTLLLLGYPFPKTLAILLPASIAVSVLQIWTEKPRSMISARQFSAWCLFPLMICLAAVLALDLQTSLSVFVAVVLTIFAILRLWPDIGAKVIGYVADHPRSWLFLTGVVHGLSNLGGGLLTIFAAARYKKKEAIRGFIAFCYSCFAAIQLGVLAVFSPELFGWHQVGYAALSAIVFTLVGRHVFRWVSAPIFDRLLTAFIIAYAGLLGARAFGLP